MKKVFRRFSVERLSSPEQLDRLLVITRVPAWIALISLFILIIAIFLWSIFGRLPITVEGNGIFFDPFSMLVIQNEIEGTVEKIFVNQGESVKKGDPLFRLKNYLKSLEYEELSELIQKLEKVGVQASAEHQWELLKLQQQKTILEESLQTLLIRAPKDGTILSIQVPIGQELEKGTTLAWMEENKVPGEKDMAYGFFPISMGQQIKPGMKVQIQFEALRSEIYGRMEGSVKDVLPFAVSKGYILESIPSEDLRRFLTEQQTTILVQIRPTKDPTTPSGYRWTTEQGPPFQISRGSVAKVIIFVEERRPITYLIKSTTLPSRRKLVAHKE